MRSPFYVLTKGHMLCINSWNILVSVGWHTTSAARQFSMGVCSKVYEHCTRFVAPSGQITFVNNMGAGGALNPGTISPGARLAGGPKPSWWQTTLAPLSVKLWVQTEDHVLFMKTSTRPSNGLVSSPPTRRTPTLASVVMIWKQFSIDLMHWRHVSITATPCWGSRLVALRARVVLEERWRSQPLSQCTGPGQPGGMACRGWPAGCMLGDGARDSASFDPQHAGAPFCDVICIRSIVRVCHKRLIKAEAGTMVNQP